MRSNSQTILGIDTGARHIGIAVFRSGHLIFYAVKTIKGISDDLTLARVRRIVGEIIREYRVTHIALERIIFVQQHRSFVKVVFDEVRNYLRKLQIQYTEYNPRTVRHSICKNEKPTKANCARILGEVYPELARYFNSPKMWQKRYYAHLLDAVAVGHVCANEYPFEADSAPHFHTSES